MPQIVKNEGVMDSFTGTGKFSDVNQKSKVLKLNLADEQDKSCSTQLVLLNTRRENFIKQLQKPDLLAAKTYSVPQVQTQWQDHKINRHT